jgi:hypothetical protein
MDELRNWVSSSLMWDGSRDPDALVDEFVEGYYSPAAAPFVHRHLGGFENATYGMYVRDGCRWGMGNRGSADGPWLVPSACYLMPWLTKFAVMNSADALTAALDAVGGQA